MITPTVVESAVDLKEISEEMEQEFSRVPPLKISRLNKVDRQRDRRRLTLKTRSDGTIVRR